jgi:citrate lyase synthetase
VLAVEATYILSQRTFPGYGHREEERVEPWIIKTLTEIPPRSKDKPFLAIGYL